MSGKRIIEGMKEAIKHAQSEAEQIGDASIQKWRKRSSLKCHCTCGKCCNHRRQSVTT